MNDFNSLLNFDFKNLFSRLSNNPVLLWLLIGLMCLGVFLLFFDSEKGDTSRIPQSLEQVKQIQAETMLSCEAQLESELTRTLESIEGVGSVNVKLNLKSKSRKIWERQTRMDKRLSQEQGAANTEESTSDEIVFAKDSNGVDRPVLKEELAPEIQGVIVVATGAKDSGIKKILVNTITTVFGIPAHRVLVLPGKEKGGLSN